MAIVRSPYAQQPISLSDALAAAKANRASVSAAQLRILSARQSRNALGSFPATKLFVGYTDKEQVGGADDDLVLVQPLDIFGNRAALRSSGDARIERAEADLQQVLAELQNAVFNQYSETAAAKAFADSASQIQEITQRLHFAISTLVQEGKLPGVQLSRVAIELERAQLIADQRRAELLASLQRLGGILDLPVEQLMVSDFADVKIDLGESANLQATRADLRVLAAEVKAAQAEARIASLGNRPELEIQGRQTSWHASERQYGLRIQLGIPLLDFGKTKAETGAARRQVEAAKKSLEDATRLAATELRASQTELESAQEQVRRYEAIVKGARALVEKSRIGFTEKAITLVELLEATRALREVEEGFVESRLKLAKAKATYLKVSGQILEAGK